MDNVIWRQVFFEGIQTIGHVMLLRMVNVRINTVLPIFWHNIAKQTGQVMHAEIQCSTSFALLYEQSFKDFSKKSPIFCSEVLEIEAEFLQ